jgi:hypothetical protein
MQSNDGSGQNFAQIRALLNDLIGDREQEEGVVPSMSPIDFLPVTEMASLGARGVTGLGKAAIESAPRLLGNEVGSVGKNIAPQIEKSLAEKLKQTAASSSVKGPEGGLTNKVAQYQQNLKQPEVNFFDRFGPKSIDIPGETVPANQLKKLLQPKEEFVNPNIETRLFDDANRAVKQEIDQEKFQKIKELLNK